MQSPEPHNDLGDSLNDSNEIRNTRDTELFIYQQETTRSCTAPSKTLLTENYKEIDR